MDVQKHLDKVNANSGLGGYSKAYQIDVLNLALSHAGLEGPDNQGAGAALVVSVQTCRIAEVVVRPQERDQTHREGEKHAYRSEYFMPTSMDRVSDLCMRLPTLAHPHYLTDPQPSFMQQRKASELRWTCVMLMLLQRRRLHFDQPQAVQRLVSSTPS